MVHVALRLVVGQIKYQWIARLPTQPELPAHIANTARPQKILFAELQKNRRVFLPRCDDKIQHTVKGLGLESAEKVAWEENRQE